MKSFTLLATLLLCGLLVSAGPAAAQYSYPGSISNYRTAPPQNHDKATGRPAMTKPVAPNMPNRTGAAQQSKDGKPTAIPTRSRTPMAVPSGQARSIPGTR
jgi:hypothetical protein